ncbi:DsrE family protein [Telluribacter sp. SYSU D00476]|uniref:DsrE family protein n=1 Tax=Telluribacter sp. SYSU D00476 TaxID=2811430 RepID=UPI001FF35673|nr:DsrE family protein [Telluribacter sp. SYSU D00476]
MKAISLALWLFLSAIGGQEQTLIASHEKSGESQPTTNSKNSSPVSTPNKTAAMKILVHITHGPEEPTRAALGFLVAKAALEEGHSVSLFLAGNAVLLLRDKEMGEVMGVGTGNLREHYEAIVKGGGRFYLSGMSAKARGMTEEDIKGKPAEFAMPKVLVQLSVEHDRMFNY